MVDLMFQIGTVVVQDAKLLAAKTLPLRQGSAGQSVRYIMAAPFRAQREEPNQS